MGNEASKTEFNNNNPPKEKEVNAHIVQEIENLEEMMRVSSLAKNKNFYTGSSKDQKISEPEINLTGKSEKFEATENSDQLSEISDLSNFK